MGTDPRRAGGPCLCVWFPVPRYGYLPQRVALWIYWQAAVLLWKGVAFHGPPCGAGYRRAAEAAATHPPAADGRLFVWRPSLRWPWR